MEKRVFFIAVVIAPLFALSAAYGLDTAKNEESKQPSTQKITVPKTVAPKAAAVKAAAPKTQTKHIETTKEEMIAELKKDLAGTKGVFSMIPELKSVISQDGKAAYTYGGVALEDLSKEDIVKLLSRVRQALVKIKTDRIQRQLEIAKQVEKFQGATDVRQPSRVPVAAPSVPKSPPSLSPTPQRR